jgi:ribonucleoside-diphosphate reductase alpha chain
MALTITKRDGTREEYNANMINKAIERACEGLPDPVSKVMQIASEMQLVLFDGITTEDLDKTAINTAVQNIKDDPNFDIIATRLLLKTIYRSALGDYSTKEDLHNIYMRGFIEYINIGTEQVLLDPRLKSLFNLNALSEAIHPERDEFLTYIGLVTMMNRYMIKDRSHKIIEPPQYLWMRTAMGLSLNEKDPTKTAIGFYHKMSRLEYLSAGSTLINVGTLYPQLSNCFVMEMHDDLDHIGKTVGDVMTLTKGTGGIGLSVTKLRGEGSPIQKTNTFSSGPVPFMHVIDSAIRAVSRAGKKLGALCFYMENWHIDFAEFLDLKQNSGDPYRRTRTANTAVWISDEFMKRVEANDYWYLFDPKEVPDLNELYGDSFSKRYAEYVEMAEAGQMRTFKKMKAREQFKAIIISLQTTSHPWLTWKDAINVRALNDNTGTIHLSNLCTEICLPQDRESVSVCNLASINLARHLSGKAVDWQLLEESSRMAVRQLDNLLEVTLPIIPEAEKFNRENRAIGIGVMGFADMLEKIGIPYESEDAYETIDRIMEFISYNAIDESANLASERGSYPKFSGSGWSKGMVPYDTLAKLEKDRNMPLSVDKKKTLDWDSLRAKVKKGIRNSTLMAIAPTASIGLVAGTSPGIDPRFAQMFSRATNSGKFLELNTNLVNTLKDLGIWDGVKEEIVRQQGDISGIAGVPNEIKPVYKTSFQIHPRAFIEVAARSQKWVDQAISRNMYLETRDAEDILDTYAGAWEKGIKTTYYLHMKPRHTAEQSTVKVNKAQAISGSGKFGFGEVTGQQKAEVDAVLVKENHAHDACPVDPAERLQCESCQ